MLSTLALAAVFSSFSLVQSADTGGAVYLSDRPDLIIHTEQGWGQLGIDGCAHAPDQPHRPMHIGDRTYEKGLGHHAPGQIVVDLNGEYETFLADVGLQPLPGNQGSVVFKVFVDNRLAFDSGTLKAGQPARSVSIPVAGATELRLEVTDAGDGITSDCANWADARLVRSTTPRSTAPARRLDVAPFARVVTSDPARMNGCTAGRTEEYRAEDVYLETDLIPTDSGDYVVLFTADGPGVIGLRWLRRRALRELSVAFVEGRAPASAEGVQLQYWAGESAWQGNWVPLKAEIDIDGNRWRVRPDWQQTPDLRKGTRRIRWVLPPAAKGAVVSRLSAVSASALDEVQLRVACDPRALGDSAGRIAPAEIVLQDGEWVSPAGRGLPPAVRWNYRTGEPLELTLRYVQPRPWRTERTVLRFRLPAGGAFGVAVDDVLKHGQVYVKDFGVFVTRASSDVTLTEYRRRIAERKTVLDEVRQRPDQTFARAIEHVHNPLQDRQPTLLSLACDNHKFVVFREGTIQFAADQAQPTKMSLTPPKNLVEMKPRFGSGKNEKLTRHLDGGWLPMPVNEVREGGLAYRQRTFVTPLDKLPLPEPGWLSPRPVCVSEFTLENTGDTPAPAALALAFSYPGREGAPALRIEGSRVLISDGDRLLACADLADSGLTPKIHGGELALTGNVVPHHPLQFTLYLPGWLLAPGDHAQLAGGGSLAERCRAYWERVMAPAAKIDIPDPLLLNVIKASQVHCLLAARNEDDGRRVAAWIASFSYGPLESEANSIIRGMDYLGHHEFARRAHDYFIRRYNEAGYLTTGYTVMGTGWNLWTLGMHYELTRDVEWLREIAPVLARSCRWIMAQREKTKRVGADGRKPPEYGLMPPGVMADWNAYAYHFYLNGYYYAALQAAASALAEIGYPDAETWRENAAEFKKDILRAYRWTQARMPAYLLRDGTAVPAYPSQVHSPGPLNRFFPGEDANRSWCYDVELGPHHLVPLGVLDPNARDVTWMMNHHEDVQFLSDGWFDYPAERNHQDWYNLGGFAKVQPYYCRNAEIYAMRDDVKPFIRSYFNTIPSLLGMENLQFQEHFAGVAAWNKTHETGYFLHQTRLMLVMERGRELWLAPFVTNAWLKDGLKVSIADAPTHFGPVSYRITSHVDAGRIEATIEPPTRQSPETIVLRLRHPEGKPMRSVTVNGAAHHAFDPGQEIIRLRPDAGPLNVVATY